MQEDQTKAGQTSCDYTQANSFADLIAANDQLVRATQLHHDAPQRRMNAVIGAIHNLCEKISTAAQDHAYPEIMHVIRPAYELHSAAPFVNRVQTWPRGMPGDFETIEIMLDARTSLPQHHPSYWIEWYALNCAIIHQHRNKLSFQREVICDRLPDNARILSVGCGGARDLMDLDSLTDKNVSICLIDIEDSALELAKSRLDWAGDVQTYCGDAISAIRSLNGTYHRIVFGGLFDYLDDRAISILLRLARFRLLAEGGKIAFTNLSSNNPFQVWIEYLASWTLLYRDSVDLQVLTRSAGIDDETLTISTDATGISHLCMIER